VGDGGATFSWPEGSGHYRPGLQSSRELALCLHILWHLSSASGGKPVQTPHPSGRKALSRMIIRMRIGIAVGTRITTRPRTQPDMRLSRIRLPPWVFDGEALIGPRVLDARTREPLSGQLRHVRPRLAIFLAATPKRAQPESGNVMVERHERTEIRRHGVLGK
jgi:hypothetical protein